MAAGERLGSAVGGGVVGAATVALAWWLAPPAPPEVVERVVERTVEVPSDCRVPECPVVDCPSCPAREPVKAAPTKPRTIDRAADVERLPAWDPDWPADLGPERFPELAAAALGSCEPFDVLDVDCDEPPCYVAFTVGDPAATDDDIADWLGDCPAWADRYGTRVDRWTRCARGKRCDDGSSMTVISLASQRALERLADDGHDRMDLKALQQERCEATVELVGCP